MNVDLSGQVTTSIPQQINFIVKLDEYNGATMFFINPKRKETILNFSLDSLNVAE